MDEYAEIYFLDDPWDYEMRNAPRDHRDHRTGASGRPRPSARPNSRTAIIRTKGRAGGTVVQPQVMTVAEPQQPASSGGFGLGDLTGVEVVELAAKVLAAIQPLPAAPLATGKADDDVANLITYQGALANHAKRDEQLRTLGDLIAKVLS